MINYKAQIICDTIDCKEFIEVNITHITHPSEIIFPLGWRKLQNSEHISCAECSLEASERLRRLEESFKKPKKK
jgi:hypothetical protein